MNFTHLSEGSQSYQDVALLFVGGQSPRKNLGSHIDASHSRQPLVKGERLVRYEVNAVIANLSNKLGLPH